MYERKDGRRYIGTKVLHAWPATLGEYNVYRAWTMPDGEDPDAPGFLVEYEEDGKPNVAGHVGYVSWSPASVFMRTYRPFGGPMGFQGALSALQNGLAVRRAGWNGPGMFAYMVPAADYPAQTGVAKSYFGADALVPYLAYFALKTAQGDVATWVPTISDILAMDWFLDTDAESKYHAARAGRPRMSLREQMQQDLSMNLGGRV